LCAGFLCFYVAITEDDLILKTEKMTLSHMHDRFYLILKFDFCFIPFVCLLGQLFIAIDLTWPVIILFVGQRVLNF